MSQRIKEIRMRKEMSQKELAERAGITQAYLSELESGKKIGGLGVHVMIAKALKCSLDELVGMEEEVS